MPTKRRPLQLLPHENELLRTLYREENIPTDQYPQRPDDLLRLVSNWNGFTGRSETAPDVLHYMVTKRKNGQWERLGRATSSRLAPQSLAFSPDEFGQLDAIHEELQIPSDSFALNPEYADKLKNEFARRTGRIVPGMILAAAMVYRRKIGNLAGLRPKVNEQSIGFKDIDEIAQ